MLAGFRMAIDFTKPRHFVRSHACSFTTPFFFISSSTCFFFTFVSVVLFFCYPALQIPKPNDFIFFSQNMTVPQMFETNLASNFNNNNTIPFFCSQSVKLPCLAESNVLAYTERWQLALALESYPDDIVESLGDCIIDSQFQKTEARHKKVN